MNEIKFDKPVLDWKNGRNTASQPIRSELVGTSELADATQVASVNALEQINTQTIEKIIATCNLANSSEMGSFSESDSGDPSKIEFANKPPPKTPICYSVNQVEILQTLGNYTFAAHFETDEFLQKNRIAKETRFYLN